MSWTAPVTRATGYIVLATDWNAIENNLLLVDRVYAKKTTAKTVNGTTSATDLLNGEFTIGAGDMGTDRVARLTTWGTFKQNVATSKDVPVFRLILGGTTMIDTSHLGFGAAQQLNQSFGWKFVCEIQNLGATNAQDAYLSGHLGMLTFQGGPATSGFTTGNGQVAYTGAAGPGSNGVVIYDGGSSSAAGDFAGVDTTAACALVFNVSNANNNAQYETKLTGAMLELL